MNTGIQLHAWNEDDLSTFQKSLSTIHLLSHLGLALRGERGAVNTFLQNLHSSKGNPIEAWAILANGAEAPTQPGEGSFRVFAGGRPLQMVVGKSYLTIFGPADQAFENNYIQQNIDAIASADGVDTSTLGALERKLSDNPKDLTRIISSITLPAIQSLAVRASQVQDQVNLTITACALERYRLVNKTYPTSLDQLVPTFLTTLPVSVIGHHPFEYRLEAPEHFRLWSLGWNGTDENGSSNPKDRAVDDWVWGTTP